MANYPRVIHVLADGTELDDITGHVVRLKDAEQLYQAIDSINKRLAKEKKMHTYEHTKQEVS